MYHCAHLQLQSLDNEEVTVSVFKPADADFEAVKISSFIGTGISSHHMQVDILVHPGRGEALATAFRKALAP